MIQKYFSPPLYFFISFHLFLSLSSLTLSLYLLSSISLSLFPFLLPSFFSFSSPPSNCFIQFQPMEGKEEERGYVEIIKMMIENGASPYSVQMALCIACCEGNLLIIDYLLSCGVPLHSSTSLLFNNSS